jgi:uncharacterized integral membrane protein (TIGR00701 family)
MAIIKTFHVLCAFIWIGNLLALTRLMGYHVKEDEQTQMRMARLYRRMYNFVGLPTMMLTIVFGAFLFLEIDPDKGINWLVFKIFFVLGLVICDVVCGQFISSLNQKPETGRGIQYKILHGIAGLLLIGVIVCIYIFRPYIA